MAAHRRSPSLPLSLLRHSQLLGSVDLLHARAIHTINRKGDFELVLSDDGDETMTLRAKVSFFIFGLLSMTKYLIHLMHNINLILMIIITSASSSSLARARASRGVGF